MENITTQEKTDSDLIKGADTSEDLNVHGHFTFECRDKDGNIKWVDTSKNIVTTEGKNHMLDTYLAGTSYTAGWWMSLATAGTAVAGSTYSSPTITEITSGIITSNLRVAMTWTAASAGAKASATVSFGITGSATITGNMVVGGTGTVTAVANTAGGGKLFSASAFSGGSKTVSSSDTLNCSYSVSV